MIYDIMRWWIYNGNRMGMGIEWEWEFTSNYGNLASGQCLEFAMENQPFCIGKSTTHVRRC